MVSDRVSLLWHLKLNPLTRAQYLMAAGGSASGPTVGPPALGFWVLVKGCNLRAIVRKPYYVI